MNKTAVEDQDSKKFPCGHPFYMRSKDNKHYCEHYPDGYPASASELATADEVCPQCEANARYNEAGGYAQLAAECRAYCLRGHKSA